MSRREPPSILITHHIVEKGDTLFAIAWRYEKDMEKLAAVNGLPPPYTLYAGQRLNLDTSGALPRITTTTSKSSGYRAQPPLKTPPSGNVPAKPPVANQQKNSRQTPVTGSFEQKFATGWRWQWPVKGRVTRSFSNEGYFKGIDITSLPDAPIYPAAPGIVVYSGTGLRGYGHLVIIKHNEEFLSAYAYNRKVYVREGQQVAQPQKIADVVGDPGNNRRFYFEIRKDGKPVNPLQYLP